MKRKCAAEQREWMKKIVPLLITEEDVEPKNSNTSLPPLSTPFTLVEILKEKEDEPVNSTTQVRSLLPPTFFEIGDFKKTRKYRSDFMKAKRKKGLLLPNFYNDDPIFYHLCSKNPMVDSKKEQLAYTFHDLKQNEPVEQSKMVDYLEFLELYLTECDKLK